MKRKLYFCYFLCAVFLLAGGQVHGANSPQGFRQVLGVKKFLAVGGDAHTEFTSSNSEDTTTNAEPDLSIEDDDDGQELIGKQAPIIKPSSILLTLSALPPPVSIASTIIASTNTTSSLGSCRYLVHRALLI